MNAVVIEALQEATASVIWLHGLGANGHDFEPVVPMFTKSLREQTRFIFPHAPNRPITINGGMVMPGWYDITEMDLTKRQDAPGIHDSMKILRGYIEKEVEKGIPENRIILAGFSQGGAVALHTGLRYEKTLAGIMALSTYLPLAETVDDEIHEANRQTSIFYGHGQFDAVIPIQHAEASREHLQKLGYSVQWHSYAMEHNVMEQEIRDIDQWLIERLMASS